jgi:hypothetical protein
MALSSLKTLAFPSEDRRRGEERLAQRMLVRPDGRLTPPARVPPSPPLRGGEGWGEVGRVTEWQ